MIDYSTFARAVLSEPVRPDCACDLLAPCPYHRERAALIALLLEDD